MKSPKVAAWLRFAAAAVLIVAGAVSAQERATPVPGVGDPDEYIFDSGFEPRARVTIDPASLTPPDGAVLSANAAPAIGLRYTATGAPAPDVDMTVDRHRVAAQAQVEGGKVRFTPSSPLANGRHVVAVRVGNARALWSFVVHDAPLITRETPRDVVLPRGAQPAISARFDTFGVGVDTARVRLLVDGLDVGSSARIAPDGIEYWPPAPLADGSHSVSLTAFDRAGASHRSDFAFVVATPPVISEAAPDGVELPFGAQPTITARFADAFGEIDPARTKLLFDSRDVTASATVEMHDASSGTIRYVPDAPLGAGSHAAALDVGNRAGAVATRWSVFSVARENAHRIEIAAPADGAVVDTATLPVTVKASASLARVVQADVNGVPADVVDVAGGVTTFRAAIDLVPGDNTVEAVVAYADGETRSATIRVEYDAPARIAITSPADFSMLGRLQGNGAPVPGGAIDLTGAVQRPVQITGTTTRPVESVSINQQQATLSADRRSFTFNNFFLHEGTNLIGANATDARGRVVTAQATVFVDQTAPLLSVEGPADGAVTSAAAIDVRGIANDAVEAGLNAPEPTVRVDNAANAQNATATARDRYYIVRDVPLAVGANVLTVVATDALGNARSRTLKVTRVAAGSQRITRLAGDRQGAPVLAPLPQPLVVAAIDRDGLPLANLPVRFDVTRGSGTIARSAGGDDRPDGVAAARNLVVATDASGQAQVWLTLGNEAGEAANMVRAWSETLAEDVRFTATGQRGAVAQVLINGLSGSQFVATDSQPVEALSAVVLDAQRNALPGTPLRFSIVEGDARFAPGAAPNATIAPDGKSIVVPADKNGVASVRPTAGSTPGNVQVTARALVGDQTVGAADFQLIVLQARNGPTGFGGVMLDHTGEPIAGVRIAIDRTSLSGVSGADGRFRFDDNVPPGKIGLHVDGRHLRIVRNGRTVQYPQLMFETAVIQGQDNQLAHPIYLPPVDLASGVRVGGNADVRVTVPGYDGFEMLVKAHSVTFPDGSTEGDIVVAPVHGDRLPMAPPGGFGSFGAIGWTIQPTGTRFDPPIQVRIPNTTGLARGETLPIVQWDHDLATYVPMGRGTVSEDGTHLVSDPGTGLTKAGWGGGPPPPPPQCATEGRLPAINSVTIRAPRHEPPDRDLLTVVRERQPPPEFLVADIDAQNCPTPDVRWELGDGRVVEGQEVRVVLPLPRRYDITANVRCRRYVCGDIHTVEKSADIAFDVVRVKLVDAFSEISDGAFANGWSKAEGNATGLAGRPYALTGVRDGNQACIRVGYELEGPAKDRARERLHFAMKAGDEYIGKSGQECGTQGRPADDHALVFVDDPPFDDAIPAFGYDRNDNGELEESEYSDDQSDWVFRMISESRLTQARNAYDRGVWWFGWLGHQWLNAFLHGSAPGNGSVDESHTVSRRQPGLTHAVGLLFPPSTTFQTNKQGQSRKVTHGPLSQISDIVLESRSLYVWVYKSTVAHGRFIKERVGESRSPVVLDFIYTNNESLVTPYGTALMQVDKPTFFESETPGVSNFPPDLYASVGDALSMSAKVRVRASWTGRGDLYQVHGVEFHEGVIYDLFDFDHDVIITGVPTWWVPIIGPLASEGAVIQAAHRGKSSSRPGGMVFENVYQLSRTDYAGFNMVISGFAAQDAPATGGAAR